MNNNIPLSFETGRGLSINYQGKSLYSKYNPSKTAKKIVESITLTDETLYILPSPLFLYGIEDLIQKLPESSFLLCIEVDQELMKLTITANKFNKEDKLQIVRLDSRESLKYVIEELGVWRFRRSELIILNNGYNLFQETYDYLFNFSSSLLATFWRNRLTINKLGKLWVKNILINSNTSNSGRPDNKGKAVVICGAGASLEDSIPLLRSNRNLLYIIAVDTALSSLLESEIKPDSVFALESQFYNLGDFYSSTGLEIDLITDITGFPAVSRQLNGNQYFFISEFSHNSLLERFKRNNHLTLTIPPLGSVGVAAVSAALNLFDSDIFLTGLDFSFVPGKSHSKGSPFISTLLRISDRFHPPGAYSIAMNRHLKKIKGKRPDTEIYTDGVLESYARLLIDLLAVEDRVFDLTTKGYPLGIPYVDKSDLIKQIKNQKKYKRSNIPPDEERTDPANFIKNEKENLLHLIQQWDSFSKSESETIPESLMTALSSVDYVYIDFPDRLPHPIRQLSFISRSVISARDYLELINRILNNQ